MNESIIDHLGNEYDEAVQDLAVEDAIEVAEGLISYVQAALMGLNDDLNAA